MSSCVQVIKCILELRGRNIHAPSKLQMLAFEVRPRPRERHERLDSLEISLQVQPEPGRPRGGLDAAAPRLVRAAAPARRLLPHPHQEQQGRLRAARDGHRHAQDHSRRKGPFHVRFSIAPHMALEGVTSLGAMTVKTKGCVITWGP